MVLHLLSSCSCHSSFLGQVCSAKVLEPVARFLPCDVELTRGNEDTHSRNTASGFKTGPFPLYPFFPCSRAHTKIELQSPSQEAPLLLHFYFLFPLHLGHLPQFLEIPQALPVSYEKVSVSWRTEYRQHPIFTVCPWVSLFPLSELKFTPQEPKVNNLHCDHCIWVMRVEFKTGIIY